MIPFNFVYYRPETLEEACEAYSMADQDGLSPLYLAGGTEIATFCRNGMIKPGALIDIKRIPECCRLDEDGDEIVFGAALPLNLVVESVYYPLLSRAARIVDHTVRNRLSLGGNITGRLPYRETVLPFLLADARIGLWSPKGNRKVPLSELFSKRLHLEPGELLVQLFVSKKITSGSWYYQREVRKTRVDYPLLTTCFLNVDGQLRMAVTGAHGFPIRSREAETVLNDNTVNPVERSILTADRISHPILEDMRAGQAYRRMLLERSIFNALQECGG